MVSIRVKLIGLIFFSTIIVWVIAAYSSFVDTRHEITALFDAHLAESARAILQQAEHEQREARRRQEVDSDKEERGDHDDAIEEYIIPEVQGRGELFEKRLMFQLRDASGALLTGSMRDAQAQPLALNSTDGFSQGSYHGGEIRVFSAWNHARTVNIQVAESMEKRRSLVNSSLTNVLMPILVMILPLLMLLTLVVEVSLRPMRLLSHEVEHRSPEDLGLINDRTVPKDIRPMVIALNNLLSQLARALANERRFTADAAHELRTPLAAIKVQAQVALRSKEDETTRSHALMGVTKGVDQATHLVDQLLTMARLDPETEWKGERVHLRSLVVDVVSTSASEAIAKNLELVVTEGPEVEVYGNPSMLRILVRNLLDNAIRYTPAGGFVHISVRKSKEITQLVVNDTGPGLSEDQRKLVTQRFSRVSRPSGEGSGLGLSIVSRIADLHRAHLAFGSGEGGTGCRVEVTFTNY